MKAKIARADSNRSYVDGMSDGQLRQIARHRATRARLTALSKPSQIILAEYFNPEAYELDIRQGYLSGEHQLVSLAQYTDLAESESKKLNVSPRRYIEKVVINGLAKERETIIEQARELFFDALNEFKAKKDKKA